MLNQGIPTGAKHCVPLANIFLSFIIRELLENNPTFKSMYERNVKIWKRFIDDCFGMFLGRGKLFNKFYNILKKQFLKYGLELTMEHSRSDIVMLDIEIFIYLNQLHTKENRKETASNLYLRSGSAHPEYTFKGIVKSQMQRLRRLCSRDGDFRTAIEGLRTRCHNSGYDRNMVSDILNEAASLKRELSYKFNRPETDETNKIRWVTLSGSSFEKEQKDFVMSMNNVLKDHHIKFEIIKTTGPSIGSLLFNNYDKQIFNEERCNSTCVVCDNDARGDRNYVVSSVSKKKYFINANINCKHSGIYAITCKCIDQYSGKTTVMNGKRFKEHWSKGTSVKQHLTTCKSNPTPGDVKVQFLENVWDRGKYSLSEREFLWTKRLKGTINVQKVISK